MIDQEGNAQIMDFGIARSVKGKGITGAERDDRDARIHVAGAGRRQGRPARVRTSIRSGIVLFEMLTGRRALRGRYRAEHRRQAQERSAS
ncbi:MAG: hypothetical protein MZV70_70345 [Desulfobacterales bacterium]|nr:hypothetical protein [Desulfobacterales bacterium]